MTILGRVLYGPLGILVLYQQVFQTLCQETEDLAYSFLGVPTVQVDALVGRNVTLPCDIIPESNDDRVYMVLWFRNSAGRPTYSFDVRGRSFETARFWSSPEDLDTRAHFNTSSPESAGLFIERVQLDDAGIYRCRVDFKNSPTRNSQIQLNVIVPPHQVLLYDDDGKDIGGVIGPLNEGGYFHLLCEVRGGRPQPKLRWLFNDDQIEIQEVVRDDEQAIVSRITLINAKRNWLNTTIRCQAINTNLVSPHERTARIDMHLRPTSAVITKKPGIVKAETELKLECVVKGSRPSPVITWYRGNMVYERATLHPNKLSSYENETGTVSLLTIYPLPEDDGVLFRCRAENTILSVGLEDSFTMSVEYKPIVALILGSTLNPDQIKEGDDVYLECQIKANPKESKILWFYNDTVINFKSHSSSMFVSNKSLVLPKVTRHQMGLYSCKVFNSMGSTTSLSFFLRVKFRPFCAQKSPMLIGARIDEQLKVRCTVTADPSDLTFSWYFNTSGETIKVSPLRYGPAILVTASGTVSELRYTTSSERDYGALLCSANNSVGKMKNPCVFQVVPATRPNPPKNCNPMKIQRKSEPYLAVRCKIGYDGGIKQHFTLEITGKPSQILVNTSGEYTGRVVWMNVTWSAFEGMLPHQNIVVIARNAKGPTEPVVLDKTTFMDAIKPVEKAEEESMAPLIAVLVGVAALLAVAVAIGAYMFWRRPETASAVASKRPSQSVVQVDSQGRRCIIAYPAPPDDATKPDILIPKSDPNGRPRVVLEADGQAYALREVVTCGRPYAIPPRDQVGLPER